MPLCGFNEKMLSGIAAFNEGLVEHGLLHRGKLNGETIQQGIRRELSDMTRLLQETHRIEDASKRMLTEGVVRYAMGFYLVMRENNIDDYKRIVEEIGEYFRLMDEKYYSELDGKTTDMKDLVEFLNMQLLPKRWGERQD